MPFAGPAIEKDTDVLVPAKELYQIVKTETAPKLDIRIHGGKFELHANNRSLVLPCSEPKNFPQIPDGELKLQGQILASALDAALHRALFCVSAESSRYATEVLRLEMRGSIFRMVGTDGHRLSLAEGAAKAAGNFTTLLLRSTGAILSRLGLAEEPRWGQFSNYENGLPKTPLEARVVFQREELLEGLTKLSPTARKGTNPAVKLELSKSPVSIKTENDGTANRVTLGHTRISGKARDVGFNHQYLTQYVKSLE